METLEDFKTFFALINVKAFCERYGLQYHDLIKVLKEVRPLTDKRVAEYQAAVEKYKEDIQLNTK